MYHLPLSCGTGGCGAALTTASARGIAFSWTHSGAHGVSRAQSGELCSPWHTLRKAGHAWVSVELFELLQSFRLLQGQGWCRKTRVGKWKNGCWGRKTGHVGFRKRTCWCQQTGMSPDESIQISGASTPRRWTSGGFTSSVWIGTGPEGLLPPWEWVVSPWYPGDFSRPNGPNVIEPYPFHSFQLFPEGFWEWVWHLESQD